MEEVLIDSDVVIDYLRGYKKRIKSFFSKIERREIKSFLSAVSIVELHAGKMGNGKHEEILRQFLSYFEILPLEANLAKLAGIIKREFKLSLADSIICATAIDQEIPLLTFNRKHFEIVKDLKLFSI